MKYNVVRYISEETGHLDRSQMSECTIGGCVSFTLTFNIEQEWKPWIEKLDQIVQADTTSLNCTRYISFISEDR